VTEPSTLYSVDTSALIDGLERYYPEKTFPALWKHVDGLIASGRFVISEEVWDEARTRDAAAKRWCDTHDKRQLVVPTDTEVIRVVQGILADYPRLVNNQKGRVGWRQHPDHRGPLHAGCCCRPMRWRLRSPAPADEAAGLGNCGSRGVWVRYWVTSVILSGGWNGSGRPGWYPGRYDAG